MISWIVLTIVATKEPRNHAKTTLKKPAVLALLGYEIGATLPAGSRISVVLLESAAVTSSGRTVYGGKTLTANFNDAGVQFTTGTLK